MYCAVCHVQFLSLKILFKVGVVYRFFFFHPFALIPKTSVSPSATSRGRYLNGEDAIQISHSLDTPPIVLVRVLIETIFSLSKTIVLLIFADVLIYRSYLSPSFERGETCKKLKPCVIPSQFDVELSKLKVIFQSSGIQIQLVLVEFGNS